MKPCNESEIVGLKSMQPSKDYYKGYDAAEKNYIRILDKIRAEIEQLPTNYIEVRRPHSTVERYVVELDAVLRVLDKYKEGK